MRPNSHLDHTLPPFLLWALSAIASSAIASALLFAHPSTAHAAAIGSYPAMAPLASYASADRDAEIAFARSAAPPAISSDAEIMVLGAHGYEKAVAGKNGFVCLVIRSWANLFDNAEFWNPKIRSPICYNAAAARTVMPEYLERTEWVLAGVPLAEMDKRTRAEVASGKIGAPAAGAMCYMLSKSQYLTDNGGAWYPHMMFFQPTMPASAWGAGLKGVQVYSSQGAPEPVTTFMVLVPRWSDGTPSAAAQPQP
ncbi:MAG TPA: hypothetical protein VG407_05255 [Caulobacteraceae bacterium]|jgi:hypothetical protein|nr:hypothetical protein [Caulobacteraceae bacterium]